MERLQAMIILKKREECSARLRKYGENCGRCSPCPLRTSLDPETMIFPTYVEDRGIETVYRFEVECHELNKKAYCKYYEGQEELEMVEKGAEE